MRRRCWFSTLMLLKLGAAISVAAVSPCETNGYSPTRIYRITDLGTLGGTESKAYHTDNFGSVWGESRTAGDTNTHAFRWRPETGMIDLSPPTAIYGVARYSSVLSGVPAVGESKLTADSPVRAVWWDSDGTMNVIPTLGGASNSAFAIDGNGVVVGVSSLSNSPNLHAFSYHIGATHSSDLGTLGGANSQANGVAKSFWSVGQSQFSADSPFYHAFIEVNGVLSDLSTLGGPESFAYDSSNSGDVVGRSDLGANVGSHAFMHRRNTGGPMVDLGALGGTFSSALSINDYGQIVGTSTLFGDSVFHAALWANGMIADLNALSATNCGWRYLEAATGVDDYGRIVGYGITEYGERHAFLLTAVPGGVGNEPPTVSITRPVSGARLIAGEKIKVRADADDSDGSISQVDFFAWIDHFEFGERRFIGSATRFPFQISWIVESGTGAFEAVATDDRGATANTYIGVTVTTPAHGKSHRNEKKASLNGIDTFMPASRPARDQF